jgi:hypothetical protein
MRKLILVVLAGFVLASVAFPLTPLKFDTNPYRVMYISYYVDGVLKGYIESQGVGTSKPLVTPGLHQVRFVWAKCNNPNTCAHFGEVTQYVNVPDTPGAEFVVQIPTVRVRWYTKYGVNISLNGGFTADALWLGVALGGGTYTGNVMAGCYTASYHMGYSQPIPAWPSIPGVPDDTLKGFDRFCVGSFGTYPTPTGDSDTDTNPPHVRITIPNYWP